MSSTFSYPRVHVVGSGAYYSYRPVTRYIEKADRTFIRDSSSRPKDFNQYGAVVASRGDGYVRGPSFEPSRFDAGRGKKHASDTADDSFFKHGEDDSIFKRGHHSDSRFKHSHDDSFLTHGHDDHSQKHTHDDMFDKHAKRDSHHKHRMDESSYMKQTADEDMIDRTERNALFSKEEDVLTRLRRKHPYRLDVENEVVPPHESSVWPENRPHFDLVSSYDTMVDFLGIREKSKN